ncbi:MAG: glycosyltransferase [Gammaproteobacteria bacterium]|jgi:glycosyltransferase involved in cell wall biosynthesis|nr:glycosyltransferase [Gammaproteobacteria bacterium]
MKTLRLAIVSTHPIQYYAPIFQALARSKALCPRVFYTWSQTAGAAVSDPGFDRAITWDIPLLEGYEFEFVPNTAPSPGTDHFRGLRNPGLIGAIEAWGADAVLVFAWNSQSHLQVMRHFKGRIPVFFRGDSTLLDPTSRWRAAARRVFLSWVYRHIDVAIAVGSNNKDYFRWCGVPEERIALAPHAIDTKRFSDPDGTHAQRAVEWRRELRIPTGARTIVFAGKFQEKKDPLLLLEAFFRCGAAGHLVFVGNGALEGELVARAGGRGDVHFLPFQNQQTMPAVYRLCDVFALPSRGPGETWGLALNEAMAARRPVIAGSKVGGARDLITPGVNGWTFQSGDLEQLTAIVANALTGTEATLSAMGAAAEAESAHWSIDAAANGIAHAVITLHERHTARR